MIKQIKVLVVDDSAFMRKVISDLLGEDPHIKVIDRARNGKEAVEKLLNCNLTWLRLTSKCRRWMGLLP